MTQHHPAAGAEVALAVDIGGTTLKGAAVDRTGRIISRFTSGTFDLDGDAYAGVLALIRMLRSDALAGGHRPIGIGLASPGLVDPVSGTITFAANLGWNSLPLRHRLESEFDLPVRVDHDARAAAVAERAASGGAASASALPATAFRDFILIPIGTGVSAAVVTGGRIVTGARGAAGEFGHMPAVPGGALCACGQHGCVEAYASATSMLTRYRALGGTAAGTSAQLAALLPTDRVAAQVWADAVEALAIGVTALTAALDPAVIVVGGGVSAAGDLLLDPLRRRVDEHLGWRPAPLIVPSALAAQGGIIGAAMLGWADADLGSTFTARSFAGLQPAPQPARQPAAQPAPQPAPQPALQPAAQPAPQPAEVHRG